MKKRLLAFALAATMMFSSVNIAFAEDTATAADDTVIAEETAVPDDVESDAAVEDESSGGDVVVDDLEDSDLSDLDAEGDIYDDPVYPHTSVDPWIASVSGSIGQYDSIGSWTEMSGGEPVKHNVTMAKDREGNDVYIYEINGTEENVYMRAGTATLDGNNIKSDKGKISGGENGGAYYYQKVPINKDFEFTAVANVIAVPSAKAKDSSATQAGFGLVVSDTIYKDNMQYTDIMEDQIAVGRIRLGADDPDRSYAWTRAGGALSKSNEYRSNAPAAEAGSVIKMSLKKSGNIYTLSTDAGNDGSFEDTTVIDNRDNTFKLNELDKNNVAVGLIVARCAEINWTEVNLNILPDVKSITVTPPLKTDYRVDEPFDVTGMKIHVEYDNGTSKDLDAVTDVNDYVLVGFDDAINKTFKDAGQRKLTVAVGAATFDLDINVTSLIIDKLTVTDAPVKLEYYAGSNFDPYGMKITATLNDGQEREFGFDDVVLTMDGKVLTKDTLFTAADSGTHIVTVTYRTDDLNIDAGTAATSFELNVNASEIVSIYISSEIAKSTFFTGQELNLGGLAIKAKYADGSEQLLAPEEYEVTGFDSSVPVESLPLTVIYKNDPTKTATFSVKIDLTEPNTIDIKGYPRTSYSVGETFKAAGLVADVVYTDSSVKTLYGDNAYYKDDAGFFTVADNGTRVAVDDATGNAQDYYMDTTGFDGSKAGEGVVKFVINKTKYPKCKDFDFKVVVSEPVEYVWKSSMMGPSATDMGTASIVVTDKAGAKHTSTAKNPFGSLPNVMVDGNIPEVDSVQLSAWSKAGKIATDQDGILYYYTEVDGDKNFELSANVTVNKYMAGVNDMSDDQKKKYDEAIAAGNSEIKAIDMARDGQEAFGIMARDTVQLAGGVGADGEYKGNAAKAAIISKNAAKIYYVFDANNICQGHYVTETEADAKRAELGDGAWIEVSDASMYEAQGSVFGDILSAGSVNYQPVLEDVKAVAVSNIVIAGGVTDGTYPTDPSSSTYQKKADMNRINILIRTGVTDLAGTGSSGKVYAVSSTEKIPEAGDVYNIKLRKFNTGYQITTKQLLDEEKNEWSTPVTKFAYSKELGMGETNNSLIVQNSDKYYLGFFACRWADINVSDIELHETDPSADSSATDTTISKTTPKVTVSSDIATTFTSYSLTFKTNGDQAYNSAVAVSLNGKRIYQESIQQNKNASISTTLVPDSINTFTLVMYPNSADNTFSNYDTTITKHYVTHSSKLADKDTIYVSPDGIENAEGTREDPVDLETAIQFVKLGGTIIMLDGTYNLRNEVEGKLPIGTGRSSYPGNPTTLKADEGAHPVIDLEKKYIGFEVDANYWIFSGLTVINSKDNEKAFGLGGDHCVVEYCTFYDNGTTAFQISRISGEASNINYWPSYNVVRSCEAFNNFDPSQNNADGFAAKLTVGYGNVFEDCISHHNADDGWDCYTKIGEGAIGASVLENCVSYKQEHKLKADGTDEVTAGSGGNGFKLGGEDIYVKHYLKDCITFENKGNGVDSNNNPAIKIRNVVAYKNMENNFGLYGNPVHGIDLNGNASDNTFDESGKQYKYDYDLEGAVSAGNVADSIYTWNVKGYEMYANLTPIEKESNYLKKDATTPSQNSKGEVLDEATFFKSTDETTVLNDMMRYSRKADGSFEHGDFLARVTPYEHKAEDLVILPDTNGGTGNVGGDKDKATNPSIEESSQTTTAVSYHQGGGGGGGSAKLVVETTTQATTAATESTSKKPVITKDVKVTIGANEIVVGDQTIPVDASAYIQAESDSTLVPLRFVAIAILGGDVENADTSSIVTWDATAKAATIKAGDDTIVFTAGSPDMVVNGETRTMDNGVKAEIANDRMYVPFRALGQALGIDVEWDAETKTASYIAPAVEEEPAAEDGITKEAILKGAEALDSILAISADRAETLAGPSKKEYTEKCDELATILQEAAYDMTDEQIAAATALLTGELLTYFTEDLPKLVSTVEETNAKIAELKDALLNTAPAEAEAETAEAETAEAETAEATTVAE